MFMVCILPLESNLESQDFAFLTSVSSALEKYAHRYLLNKYCSIGISVITESVNRTPGKNIAVNHIA